MGMRVRFTGTEPMAVPAHGRPLREFVLHPGDVVEMNPADARKLIYSDAPIEKATENDAGYQRAKAPRVRHIYTAQALTTDARPVSFQGESVRMKALMDFSIRLPGNDEMNIDIAKGEEFDLPDFEAESFQKSMPGVFKTIKKPRKGKVE